jgi:galactose mutarotase-like enzyme
MSSSSHEELRIGGLPPVFLHREASCGGQYPEFLGATTLPGRGMNVFQVQAAFPGLGECGLLASPSLEEAQHVLSGGPDDFMGDKSFSFGGAILLPYANRIRGRLLPDGCTLETDIMGHTVRLPANWHGQHPGAEKCAMHGLILATPVEVVEAQPDHVTAILHAGNFGGHWLSLTDVLVEATLRASAFELSVTARNIGTDLLPVGIGWHPYFALPSGQREQARIRLPAHQRALVNNYDDEFPTGQIVNVAGTPYDFTAAGGAPLGTRYFDDCFLDLDKTAEGYTAYEIFDPAARYGVRITALSPDVRALQVYSRPDKAFVVIEPQFNYADPYSPVWPPGRDTGMVVLPPGAEVTWAIRWELFVMTNAG